MTGEEQTELFRRLWTEVIGGYCVPDQVHQVLRESEALSKEVASCVEEKASENTTNPRNLRPVLFEDVILDFCMRI